ncbi:AAEL013311-PA, partial [Aedes aegypti]
RRQKKNYKSFAILTSQLLHSATHIRRKTLASFRVAGVEKRLATKGFKIGQLNSIRFNEDGTARMHEGEIVIKKVQGHVPKSGAPREKPAKDATITYR